MQALPSYHLTAKIFNNFHDFLFPAANHINRASAGILESACRKRTQAKPIKGVSRFMLDRVSLLLVIIGALNWLLVGLFQFDAVAWLCGGQTAVISRIIYAVVGIAGLWCVSLLFREREPVTEV